MTTTMTPSLLLLLLHFLLLLLLHFMLLLLLHVMLLLLLPIAKDLLYVEEKKGMLSHYVLSNSPGCCVSQGWVWNVVVDHVVGLL